MRGEAGEIERSPSCVEGRIKSGVAVLTLTFDSRHSIVAIVFTFCDPSARGVAALPNDVVGLDAFLTLSAVSSVVDVVPFTSPSALGKLGRLPVVVTPSSEFKMSLKSAPFIENRIEGRAGSTKNAEVRSCTVNTGDGASTCMSLSRLATLECIGDDGFPLDVDPLAAGVDVVIVVAVALLGRRGVN